MEIDEKELEKLKTDFANASNEILDLRKKIKESKKNKDDDADISAMQEDLEDLFGQVDSMKITINKLIDETKTVKGKTDNENENEDIF